MISTLHAKRLLALVAAATLGALPLLRPDSARCAEPPTQNQTNRSSSSDAKRQLDTVTISAQKRRELKRQISYFVSSAVVTYMNDSLERWNTPICPLVAGLDSDRGEYVLARLSQIARASAAPLAGEHCRPNFYVVATTDPDLLVKKWTERDRGLVNTCNGAWYVRDFLHSREPVRVWYNASFRSSDGLALPPEASGLDFNSVRLSTPYMPCTAGGRAGSRLSYGAVQALSSVIIVVDTRRTVNLNIGQLADYLAMVGFAQIQQTADTGTAPTILRLFRHTDPPPQGLSLFDQAFLHSLYTTDQTSVLQVSTIKAGMLNQIGP